MDSLTEQLHESGYAVIADLVGGEEVEGGGEIPLIDGGAFDWLRKLCSNNKLSFVASAMGSQLMAYLLHPQ